MATDVFSQSLQRVQEVSLALQNDRGECVMYALGAILADYERFRQSGTEAQWDLETHKRLLKVAEKHLEDALSGLFRITQHMDDFVAPCAALFNHLERIRSVLPSDMYEHYRKGVERVASVSVEEKIKTRTTQAYLDLQPLRMHLSSESFLLAKLRQNLSQMEREFVDVDARFHARLHALAQHILRNEIQRMADIVRKVLEELEWAASMFQKMLEWEERLSKKAK